MQEDQEEKLSFTEHLEELRKRFIICLAAVGVGFLAAYGFSEQIFLLLSNPLIKSMPEGSSFIFTGVTEAFFTYMKLAFFAGIFMASPVIIYQIWAFVAPGLYDKERRSILPFVLLAIVFFIGGTAFAYFVVFPSAFKFFMTYNTHYVKIMPSIGEYLSFSCLFLLGFGVVFELPVFIVCLARLGIIKPAQLSKNRKYVIILIFVVSAILTPSPDAVSQLLMAMPLLLLYEISIMVARMFGKKPAADDADADMPAAYEQEQPDKD
jgi:sec-independent protein translocase protein TatC